MAETKQDPIEEKVNEELIKVTELGPEELAKIEDPLVLKKVIERVMAENNSLLAGNKKLKEVNGQYIKDNEEAQLSLKDALALIDEQQRALSADAIVSDVPVITVGKEKYRVLAPKVSVEGTEYEAGKLKDNMEVVKHLVKIKSGILELVK